MFYQYNQYLSNHTTCEYDIFKTMSEKPNNQPGNDITIEQLISTIITKTHIISLTNQPKVVKIILNFAISNSQNKDFLLTIIYILDQIELLIDDKLLSNKFINQVIINIKCNTDVYKLKSIIDQYMDLFYYQDSIFSDLNNYIKQKHWLYPNIARIKTEFTILMAEPIKNYYRIQYIYYLIKFIWSIRKNNQLHTVENKTLSYLFNQELVHRCNNNFFADNILIIKNVLMKYTKEPELLYKNDETILNNLKQSINIEYSQPIKNQDTTQVMNNLYSTSNNDSINQYNQDDSGFIATHKDNMTKNDINNEYNITNDINNADNMTKNDINNEYNITNDINNADNMTKNDINNEDNITNDINNSDNMTKNDINNSDNMTKNDINNEDNITNDINNEDNGILDKQQEVGNNYIMWITVASILLIIIIISVVYYQKYHLKIKRTNSQGSSD